MSVFATTNMPWELDIAALKRFERRILVPMPEQKTRVEILRSHVGSMHSLTEKDFDFLAARTEGYSGSDLSTLVNDGLMRPIKALQQAGYFRRVKKSEMKAKIEEYKANYMIYSESLDDDSGDDPQHTAKPITTSGIGESNDGSLKSSSGSQGVEE